MASGNVPAAICSASVSSLIGIFLTPVLVGLGEQVPRSEDEVPDEGPPAMMAEAVRRAVDDAGARDGLLRRLDVVAAVPSLGWPDGIAARFTVEGWSGVDVDGRDHDALEQAFRPPSAAPHVVVAHVEPKEA